MRSIVTAALFAGGAFARQDVLTGSYDNYRTNADLNETVLNPSGIDPSSFGKLFTLSVDGQIYAQPLYRQNVTIDGEGAHNVVFVATTHNSVYAFDADSPAPPLWTVNLGPSVPTAHYDSDVGPYSDITPENGILGTPVIDAATGTLYVVAATFENNEYVYRLHALDTGSGAERFGAPATISGETPGIGDNSSHGLVTFDASQHIQRPALLLANGIVYVSFGSHGDAAPYHGWVMGYSATNVQNLVALFNVSPNGSGGAFWQSGRGPAVDDAGNVYLVASNGDTDFTSNFSDSVLKLDSSRLTAMDWFAPFNFQTLNDTDNDLGACGPLLIPGTNDLITGGKQGVLYLLDRTSLGHLNASDAQIPQSVNTGSFGIFSLALWNRPDGPIVYVHTANSPVTAWKMSGNRLPAAPTAQSLGGFNTPFQGMTLSANGTEAGSGILWVLTAASYPLPAAGVLHAYDAEDMSEIWNSAMNDSDAPGGFVKFANPTVANGKVYVPSLDYGLAVYGMNAGATVSPLVTGIVNAASYAAGSVAPGELLALFGENLGPQSLVTGSFEPGGGTNQQLDGTQITFNGIPAPLIYTSAGAASAIVPFEIAGASTVTVQVSYNGQVSSTQMLPVAAAAPGLFSADATGSGPGAILNQDYSVNSPDKPAKAGSVVVVYATGGGQTNPPSDSGSVTTEPMPLAAGVSATVGGQPAQVLYAGNAGGEVAGVTQLNLQLPAGVTGQVPVVVTVGGQSSQSTVTVSIQ
ncbi:MAG TPA: hypothetical protein VHB50_03340 [Bryobacteraceae bacterium]|nr:hypothetical protein [Bryobacteraceae bacterium]